MKLAAENSIETKMVLEGWDTAETPDKLNVPRNYNQPSTMMLKLRLHIPGHDHSGGCAVNNFVQKVVDIVLQLEAE